MSQWIHSSKSLPGDGEVVLAVAESGGTVMRGVYGTTSGNSLVVGVAAPVTRTGVIVGRTTIIEHPFYWVPFEIATELVASKPAAAEPPLSASQDADTGA